MDNNTKKELKEKYLNNHPEKGIVAWKSKDNIWVATSNDTSATFNSTYFQLKLGSWPNFEMQNEYTKNPVSFNYSVEKVLEYDDITKDYSDDLELMLMEYMDEHPEAKFMKNKRKR